MKYGAASRSASPRLPRLLSLVKEYTENSFSVQLQPKSLKYFVSPKSECANVALDNRKSKGQGQEHGVVLDENVLCLLAYINNYF